MLSELMLSELMAAVFFVGLTYVTSFKEQIYSL